MIFNELGVCNSYQTVRRDQYPKFAEKIAEGFPKDKLKPFAHLSTLFANRGYRRGGSALRVGYDQCVFLFYWVEQLESFVESIRHECRSSRKERKPLLSRLQQDWATERKTVGYTKSLFQLQMTTYDSLSVKSGSWRSS
jgi:hypothetical protein